MKPVILLILCEDFDFRYPSYLPHESSVASDPYAFHPNEVAFQGFLSQPENKLTNKNLLINTLSMKMLTFPPKTAEKQSQLLS